MSGVDELDDQAIIDLIYLIDTKRRPLLTDDARDLCTAFQQVQKRHLHLDPELLARWIGAKCRVKPQPGIDAIGAAVDNDSPDVRMALRATLGRSNPSLQHVPVLDARTLETVGDAPSPDSVRVFEDNQRARVQAARALGLLHDTQSADAIVDLLLGLDPKRDALAFGFVIVALEMLGQVGVAPRLQAMIPTADIGQVYWLNRAIERLTGHSLPFPDVDWRANPKEWDARLRAGWAGIDLTRPPTPQVDLMPVAASLAEAVVTNGRAMFALTPDDPRWNTSWPEWEYSWCHDRQRLYDTGSVCSTCEVVLSRVGWSPAKAVELAQAVRQQVGDVTSLSEPLLDALTPLLESLASGRYQIRLLDLPLEAVAWSDTWFAADSDPSDVNEHPSERFYQPPSDDVTDGLAIPLVIAPTQPDSDLNPATVTDFKTAIKCGQRPAVIAVAYPAERQAWNAEEAHKSVTGFIIDGHHKAAAYADLHVPVRTILICDKMPRQPAYTEADPIDVIDECLQSVATVV
ncbi:MAG: hypothetical protein FWD63_06270 [Propionibacteriaceae bacterium]|nr:hypothetical protein [Propionibacteriaceae bacterium]